jgi:hypothetical protein
MYLTTTWQRVNGLPKEFWNFHTHERTHVATYNNSLTRNAEKPTLKRASVVKQGSLNFFTEELDMARTDGIESLNIGLTQEALDRLEELRGVVGKEIGRRGLTANVTAAWAVHYVLGLGGTATVKAIKDGKAREDAIKAGLPEPKPNPGSEPSPAAVNVAPKVWTKRIEKPGMGGADRLNGDRPAARKVSKPPRRK